jgi:NitT/TauT family transport system ATP-binding protein/sulfonate transport system ATP-binding protein
MQRRVALARALAVNPDLLLLDEPFVSLDRALVTDLQRVFLSLFDRQHPTVLLVTHWPEDAAILADRAILLDGRPLRIVGDFQLEGKRGERSRAHIEQMTALISEHRTEATR